MKMTSTFHNLKHPLAILILALTLTLPLPAAITDDDLAKVTQLIQEGKTTRAKQKSPSCSTTIPTTQTPPNCGRFWIHWEIPLAPGSRQARPTAHQRKKRLKWIQSHLAQLDCDLTCTLNDTTTYFRYTVSSINLKNRPIDFCQILWRFFKLLCLYVQRHRNQIYRCHRRRAWRY